MGNLRVIDTADGSHSILNTDLNETYHSVHGAVRESTHVFIDQGLRMAMVRFPGRQLKILEIGFGTGLNAMLTLLEAARDQLSIYYETWEKHPLPSALIDQLNYGTVLGEPEVFSSIHGAAWDSRTKLNSHFELFKRERDVLVQPVEERFDLIYYDAFAPSKQPELWTSPVLSKITEPLVPGGIWVTYCAKGQVKRDLAALGLTVETLPGPPGKKEMTRATKT